eukprot:TRINITY_DN4079_c0_g1_i3.p1 TRINITY_DN4079_c0_g1~~TRINITY_DN4079_c0_g1_i3.p1  ORF type:complete len:205 (+),score=5.96 TRINITY_DN4079_c0_g1_i3:239-853(+)
MKAIPTLETGNLISVTSPNGLNAASNTTIYIGNLSPDVTPEMLEAAFNPFGEVTEIKFPVSRVGIAFISFKDRMAAEEALSMNGTVIGANSVKISWGRRAADTHPGAVGAPTPFPFPRTTYPQTYPTPAAGYGVRAPYGYSRNSRSFDSPQPTKKAKTDSPPNFQKPFDVHKSNGQFLADKSWSLLLDVPLPTLTPPLISKYDD